MPTEHRKATPSPRRRSILVAVLVVEWLIAAGISWSQHRVPPPPTFAITELDESITVTIGDVALGKAARLALSGVQPAANAPLTRVSTIHSVGLVAYRAEQWVEVVGGRAELTVPTAAMRESGQHQFTVFTDAQYGELGVWVPPGPPTAGLVPIVGPSRVEADGQSPVLVTVVPTDRFGNPVASDTEIELVVRRPDGGEERYRGSSEALLAGIRVPSTTAVGVVSVVAIVDGVPSEPAEFSQVAGPPARATLSTDAQQILADGRSVISVTAAEVVDSNGNPVTDGTAVRAHVDGPNGSSTLDAQVVNGRAVFLFRAPSAPGDLVFRLARREFDSVATSDADVEATLDLDAVGTVSVRAEPAVRSFDARFDETGAVEIGPVLAPSGGYVADGTPANLLVDGRRSGEVQIVDGYARLTVPTGLSVRPDSDMSIEVLGKVEAVGL